MIAVLLITILKGNNIIQPSVLKGHISHPHMILNGALLYGTLNAFHVISADFLAIEINNDLMARGIYRSVPLLVEIIMLASNSSSILKGRNWFPIIGLIGPILAASSYIGLGYFKLNPIAILIIFGLVSYSASDVMIGVETSRQENNYRPSFVRYIVISIIPMLSAKIYGYYGNYESVLWFYTTAVMVQFLLNLRSLLRRKDVQDQPASNEETANESLPKHHASHLRYASNASEGRSITETLASRTWHSRALGNDYRVIGPSRYMPQSRNIVVPELSSIDSDGSIAGSVE